MLLTLTVPEGLGPGDKMLVAAPNGQEFELCVPEGCFAGASMEVDLPVETPTPPADEAVSGRSRSSSVTVEVVVPEGCFEGTEFPVDWGGLEYNLTVPEGLGPGELLQVELPALEDEPPIPDLASGSSADGEMDEAVSRQAQELSPVPSHFSELRAVASGGEYFVGQELEVMRSNGSWSGARLLDYDDRGDTYTVELLEGGALKYLVETGELRAGREGSFRRGALCEVRQGETVYPGARIDAYDDETGTYTVRRFDTGPRGRGLLTYVEEGEVRGVSYW